MKNRMKLACGALLLLSAFGVQANEIGAGQSLQIGQSIDSDDGKYFLVQQSDGNLVLYRRADMKPIWAAYASGTFATIQTDGNFVLYRGEATPANAVWNSGTGGGAYSRNYRLGVSNLGHVYIMDPQGKARWGAGGDRDAAGANRLCTVPNPPPALPTYSSPQPIPLCFSPGQPNQRQSIAFSCSYAESKSIASYYGATLGTCQTWP